MARNLRAEQILDFHDSVHNALAWVETALDRRRAVLGDELADKDTDEMTEAERAEHYRRVDAVTSEDSLHKQLRQIDRSLRAVKHEAEFNDLP